MDVNAHEPLKDRGYIGRYNERERKDEITSYNQVNWYWCQKQLEENRWGLNIP